MLVGVGWLVDRLIACDWLIDYLFVRLIDWFTDWLNNWLADWLTDRLSDWLINWLTDRSIEWLTGWFIFDWLIFDCLFSWLIDWSTTSYCHSCIDMIAWYHRLASVCCDSVVAHQGISCPSIEEGCWRWVGAREAGSRPKTRGRRSVRKLRPWRAKRRRLIDPCR